jgi:hypothetical protein
MPTIIPAGPAVTKQQPVEETVRDIAARLGPDQIVTASGVLDAQAVIIDARRHAGRQVAPVIAIGALARYDRPAPALDAYDQLLTRTMP